VHAVLFLNNEFAYGFKKLKIEVGNFLLLEKKLYSNMMLLYSSNGSSVLSERGIIHG